METVVADLVKAYGSGYVVNENHPAGFDFERGVEES